MIILTFAHKGEAAEFIRRKHTLPVDFYFPGLYRDSDELLLLTGTGGASAAEKLSSVCSYFGSKIDAVLNLGIAGGLHPIMETNQIYGIHRILHEFENVQYTCASPRADRTCITAGSVVADPQYGTMLRERGADCVDMEGWWLAAFCNRHQVPFQAYKLISDRADHTTDAGVLIKKASVFSKHLFDFYKKLDYSFLLK